MSCCCLEKINVGPLFGLLRVKRSQQYLPSPKRLSVPAQVCKKASSVDVRRSKLHHIPVLENDCLETTWIMTSSIVPLSMKNDREILQNLRATWLSLGYRSRRQSARRVYWRAKFFFEFWPPILQSKTPIRTPTPPLTRHQDFVLLTYFDDSLLYAPLEKVTTSNQLTVRNETFVCVYYYLKRNYSMNS